ncbi:MAG: hypothetical protein AB8I08_21565 [Sandaracinaceae bacterium]
MDIVLATIGGQRWICLPEPTPSPAWDPNPPLDKFGPVAGRRCPPLDGSRSPADFQAVDLREQLHPWILRMSPAERLSALPTLELLAYPGPGECIKPLGVSHRSLDTLPEEAQQDLAQGVTLNGYISDRLSFPERIPDLAMLERGTGVFLYKYYPHETQTHGQTEVVLWVDLEVTQTDWNLTRRLLWEASERGDETS